MFKNKLRDSFPITNEEAQKFLEEDPTLSDLEAYVLAYNEWIK